jgi:cell division protein FtsI (penicillin-binding protein 3)
VPRLDRPALVHAGLAALAVALVVKAAEVQLVHADDWRKRAARQQLADAALPAPRGTIVDATGRVLVESRELVRLRVAPRDVRDRPRLGRLLAGAGVPRDVRAARHRHHAQVGGAARRAPAERRGGRHRDARRAPAAR